MPGKYYNLGDGFRPKGPFTINRDSPQAQGLIYWWPIGYDLGNERDMVRGAEMVNSGSTLIQGGTDTKGLQSWKSRSFDGTDDFLEVETAVVTGVPFTITCQFIATAGSANNDVMVFVGDKDVTNQNFELLMASATTIKWRLNLGNATTAGNSLTAGLVNTAIGVAAAVDSRTVYLNGDVANKNSDTTSVTPTGLDRTSIGRRGSSSPGGNFDGKIWDVRIYNWAFTDLEAEWYIDPRRLLDLYYPLGRKTFSFGKAVAAAGNSRMAAIAARAGRTIMIPGPMAS